MIWFDDDVPAICVPRTSLSRDDMQARFAPFGVTDDVPWRDPSSRHGKPHVNRTRGENELNKGATAHSGQRSKLCASTASVMVLFHKISALLAVAGNRQNKPNMGPCCPFPLPRCPRRPSSISFTLSLHSGSCISLLPTTRSYSLTSACRACLIPFLSSVFMPTFRILSDSCPAFKTGSCVEPSHGSV